MLGLSLTTSTDQGSFALIEDGTILYSKDWFKKSGERVTVALDTGFKKIKKSPSSLGFIAVDIGPGSFTGTRIGVNVARTMGQALNIPLVPYSSLEILIAGAQIDKSSAICAVLDAHKSLYYTLLSTQVDGPKALSQEDVLKKITANTLVLGDYPDTLKAAIKKIGAEQATKKSQKYPHAETLAKLAESHLTRRNKTWSEVEPLYIRSPEVVEKMSLSQGYPT